MAFQAKGCGSGFAADYKKGRGWRRRLCRRVVFASAQGATAPAALKVADCPAGNEYKVSVTGLAFYVIWYDKHSADWLAALASPYPAAPDFPRKRGQNKTPRNILFISISTVSTGCCAPSKRGKGGGASHQRGDAFPRPQGGCKGFFIRGRLLYMKGAPPPPFEPSEPFEPGRRKAPDPSSPIGACPSLTPARAS